MKAILHLVGWMLLMLGSAMVVMYALVVLVAWMGV